MNDLAKIFETYFNQIATLKKNQLDQKEKLISLMNESISNLTNSKANIIISIAKDLRCANHKDHPNKHPKIEKLACSHSICEGCLKKQIELALDHKGDETLIEKTICPKCSEYIPVIIIEKIIPKADLDKLIMSHGFKCQLCGGFHLKKELHTLNCGHSFKLECYKSFIVDLINKGRVTKDVLICLADGCGCPLSSFEILLALNSGSAPGNFCLVIER